jgi:parallel beta-helix repeat protein
VKFKTINLNLASAVAGALAGQLFCPNAITASFAQTQPAYYVAPWGNDWNNGTSPGTPFQTLEKAQGAMQSNGISTTYLRGGTYNRSQSLNLWNGADAWKTWAAYPGETPILDGGGWLSDGIFITAPGVTITGLTFQNFAGHAVGASNATNITVSYNTMTNIRQGPVIEYWSVQNSKIDHNTINNSNGWGIMVASDLWSNSSNDIISYNTVLNTCTTGGDCGAVYVEDNGGTGYGEQVVGNTIGGCGQYANDGWSGGKCIYLDDAQSNTLVSGNKVYGPGIYGIQIHGGVNNTVVNNIFDVSQLQFAVGLYQSCGGSCWGGTARTDMHGNAFKNNIVYSSGSLSGRMWSFWNSSGGAFNMPWVHQNIWYGANGTYADTGGDDAPIYSNPLFVDPWNHNYDLQSGSVGHQIGF